MKSGYDQGYDKAKTIEYVPWDRFNNRKGIVELQFTKKEGDTHVILQSHGTCVKVLSYYQSPADT